MEKKSSFSFGTGIAIAYIGFVVFMLGMVYLCIKQTDIHLVTDRYYQEELAYQNRIDQIKNAKALSALPELQIDTDQAHIQFPEESLQATGKVTFYRPSDPSADFEVPIDIHQQDIAISLPPQMRKGLWNAEIAWEKNGTSYYFEQKFQK